MNTKTKKTLSAATVASVLITSSVAAVNVKAASVTVPESPRLWGADRYETAVKVSQAGWTSTSDYAIIASGEGFADALCAAPLAKANNAPILLTSKDSISQSTLDELKRLNVKHIYIVGGQGVVSEAVAEKIKSVVSVDIQRLGGQNRYETSVKIAEKVGVSTKIVLASGEGFADALSAAPVAAIEGMPILLTQSTVLSDATANYIKANSGITKTYVIGGVASVSATTASSVPGAERFGGANRFETNAKVIEGFAADFNFGNVYVALGHGPIGNEFADALTGSALAGKNKNALVITGKELDGSTKNLLKSKLTASSTITVLGGVANVSDALLSEIKALAPTKTSTGGGGGGSSSSSDNILSSSTVKKAAQTYIDKVNDNATLQKYITASIEGNTIVLESTADYSNVTSLSGLFGEAKDLDIDALEAKLTKVNEVIEAHTTAMDNIKIGDNKLSSYLENLNSQYITNDGQLNVENIAAKMKNDDYTYEDFKTELQGKIEEKYSKSDVAPEVTITLGGVTETVTKITRGSTDIYDTDLSKSENIEGLVELGNLSKGTYRIYCGSEYFVVEFK